MPTMLNKTIKRTMVIDDVKVMLELSPSGLSFRLPGKRNRAKVPWRFVLDLIPESEWCRDANRTLRRFLGLPGGSERIIEKKIKERDDKLEKFGTENKELKKKLAKIKKQDNKLEKLKAENKELKKKLAKIRKVVK